MSIGFRIAFAFTALFCATTALHAQDSGLPQPEGEILLEVVGAISRTNAEGVARFDAAMLEALPQQTYRTATIWTEGVVEFSGPALRSVLEAVGADAGQVSAAAVNDYAVTLPASVIEDTVPIIATRMNNEPFSRRERGPLWIVFPYDADPKYNLDAIYAMSIWQLVRINVLKE